MFRKATGMARDKERAESLQRFNDSLDVLEKSGMNVTRNADIDTDAFIKSVQPVWNAYRAKFGDDLIKSCNI
jgi:TRAP-type C4-dicarboxylate transport system substrate-binding protein